MSTEKDEEAEYAEKFMSPDKIARSTETDTDFSANRVTAEFVDEQAEKTLKNVLLSKN